MDPAVAIDMSWKNGLWGSRIRIHIHNASDVPISIPAARFPGKLDLYLGLFRDGVRLDAKRLRIGRIHFRPEPIRVAPGHTAIVNLPVSLMRTDILIQNLFYPAPGGMYSLKVLMFGTASNALAFTVPAADPGKPTQRRKFSIVRRRL